MAAVPAEDQPPPPQLDQLRRQLSAKPHQIGFVTAESLRSCSMLSLLGRDADWSSTVASLTAAANTKQCLGVEVEHALPSSDEATAAQFANELFTGILQVPHLQYLSLRWLTCPPSAWAAFASEKSSIQNLRILELERCKLKNDDMQHICPFLAQQPFLESVSFAHNPLGASGVKSLLAAIQSSKCHLQELSLAACSLAKCTPDVLLPWPGVGGGSETTSNFASLQELNLSSNRLQSDGLLALLPLLEQASGLVSLNLRSNALGGAGAATLASILPRLPRLQQLDIGGNQFGEEAITALAPSLPSSLVALDVGNNGMGSPGVQCLLTACKAAGQLRKLDFSRCKMCYIGARAVADAVADGLQLTHLNVADNKFKDAGAVWLCEQLRSSLTLQAFDLTACGLSDASVEALDALVESCTSLVQLRLAANKLAVPAVQRMLEIVQARQQPTPTST